MLCDMMFYRTIDLESALIDGCDFGTLRNICKGRPIPDHLRPEIWQVCEKPLLNVWCIHARNILFSWVLPPMYNINSNPK